MSGLDAEQLESLYDWLDSIPFSRPKKNLARDFSDGILVAELIANFFPQMIQMHNYTPSSASARKKNNWEIMNRKVLSKLDCAISEQTISDLITAKLEVTEYFLHNLRCKIHEKMKHKADRVRTKPRNTSKTFDSHFGRSGDAYGEKQTMQPTDFGDTSLSWGEKNDKKRVEPDISGLRITEKTPRTEKQFYRQEASYPDTVPSFLYEQKEQEILMKEESIQILQARIRRLEYMLHLKDKKIEELREALSQTQTMGNNIPVAKTETAPNAHIGSKPQPPLRKSR